MRQYILLVFLSLLISQISLAQKDTDSLKNHFRRFFWAEGGAGIANGNVGIQGSAVVEVLKNFIFSYEYDGSFGLYDALGDPENTETNSWGVTLGLFRTYGKKLVYFTGGIAKNKGVVRTGTLEKQYDAWGAKLRWGFLYSGEYMAFGFSPYMNINNEIIYGGVTANMAFGRFKERK